MKKIVASLLAPVLELWRGNPALRRFLLSAAALLLVCLLLGGLRWTMLALGYVQLLYLALFPGELVEIHPRQRLIALGSGIVRMLFFTAVMIGAAWPFGLMGAVQAACLLASRQGERRGMDMSPLPLLSSAGFTALALPFAAANPAAVLMLAGALLLTAEYLLRSASQTLRQLAMRFHAA